MTLTFSPSMQAMVMTYLRSRVQGQQSVGSEVRVETDKRTDRQMEAIALPPLLMRSIKDNNKKKVAVGVSVERLRLRDVR